MRRILTPFLLVFTLCLLVITGVHMIARRQPAESGWIAYSTELSGDVMIVRRDGRVSWQLNPSNTNIVEFAWMKDQQAVLVTMNTPVGFSVHLDIFQIPIETQVIEQITHLEEGLSVSFLQVSPDGDWVYYVLRYEDRNGNCVRTHLATLAVEPLTMLDRVQDQKTVLRCWISPNGQRLVTTVYDDASGQIGLYLVDIATKTLVNLQEDTNMGPQPSVSWSPDSQQLVLSSGTQGETVLIIPIDDPTHETRLSSRFIHPSSAIWSPDGEWIAYIVSGQGKRMLYLVHPDGSDEKIFYETYEVFGTEPEWSANGRWLAMGVSNAATIQSDTVDLMIFEVDGSTPPKIIADDVALTGSLAWSPPLDMAWSPNGFLIGGVACILAACLGQYIANHPRR